MKKVTEAQGGVTCLRPPWNWENEKHVALTSHVLPHPQGQKLLAWCGDPGLGLAALPVCTAA